MLEGFESLNPEQREAVNYKHDGALQVVAGPGTGKTEVLTSRVAYQIKSGYLKPEQIVIVTYTVKAAEEVKNRLESSLDPGTVSRIQMLGTFHAVARKYLTQYGKCIGIDPNFEVADDDKQLSVITELVEKYKVENPSIEKLPTPKRIQAAIVRYKKKRGPSYHEEDDKDDEDSKDHVDEIRKRYEKALRAQNALDYEDLINECLRLFRFNKTISPKISHVFVDEFQDTGHPQYSLLCDMTKHCHAMTVIGDPNQSIYSWNGAKPAIFNQHLKRWPDASRCFLRENYRSSGNILKAASALLEQDPKRISTDLLIKHADGPPVTIQSFKTPKEQAQSIAKQIKHMLEDPDQILTADDFAILLRLNALSRNIEIALRTEGIPYKMAGKHLPFFQLEEIRDLVAYLQLVNATPGDVGACAFKRVGQIYGLTAATVEAVLESAHQANAHPLYTVFSISSLPADQQKALATLVHVIKYLRTLNKTQCLSETIEDIWRLPGLQEHLDRLYGEDMDVGFPRKNKEEFKTFADEIEAQHKASLSKDPDAASRGRLLQHFLDISQDEVAFSSTITASRSTPQVTISTIHGAKGREWAAVFIPAVWSDTPRAD